jgi:hypothetical protein
MKNNYKILCTGNPNDYTIARAVKQIFPEANFASRATGFDLRLQNLSDETHFRKVIKQYNVFINSSYIESGVQRKLLEIVDEEWDLGNIFNIGSTAEYEGKNFQFAEYAAEKRYLRDISLAKNNFEFKTTHMTIAGFNDNHPDHATWLDPLKVAQAIKLILDSNINIPIIVIEK